MIKIEFNSKKKQITIADPSSVSSLSNGHYGEMKKGVITLSPEEALYIVDIRNGQIFDENNKEITFNELCLAFTKNKKLIARYLTYKDWRDKGLVIRPIEEARGNYGRSNIIEYKEGKFESDTQNVSGLFFKDDLISVVDEMEKGKELYEKNWIGQFGTYKAYHRGKISKLDIYETLFLLENSKLKTMNAKKEEIFKIASKRIKFFSDLYEVYNEWRSLGYVLKTGFKFGTHFRIYFPGASPVKTDTEWMHSKHAIHVFPRKHKQLISEWSRAIRVAHSVKKTFILAISGKMKKSKKGKKSLDFLLYHRKQGGIETPKEGNPKYLMYSLSEDEYIGGEELSEALAECAKNGLEMMMAITDRESSVTYYQLKKIQLPGSKFEYFEIDWVQP